MNKDEIIKRKDLNVDDLNSDQGMVVRVITLTIQEADIIKFSKLCEDKFKEIHPDALINYSVNNIGVQTGQGQIALLFVANFQYWVNEAEHKEWIEELNRKNLFIKP